MTNISGMVYCFLIGDELGYVLQKDQLSSISSNFVVSGRLGVASWK